MKVMNVKGLTLYHLKSHLQVPIIDQYSLAFMCVMGKDAAATIKLMMIIIMLITCKLQSIIILIVNHKNISTAILEKP
jgi:hypothetical protein